MFLTSTLSTVSSSDIYLSIALVLGGVKTVFNILSWTSRRGAWTAETGLIYGFDSLFSKKEERGLISFEFFWVLSCAFWTCFSFFFGDSFYFGDSLFGCSFFTNCSLVCLTIPMRAGLLSDGFFYSYVIFNSCSERASLTSPL